MTVPAFSLYWEDIAALTDAEFAQLWELLGKMMRQRAAALGAPEVTP